jgi:hypothetical protein
MLLIKEQRKARMSRKSLAAIFVALLIIVLFPGCAKKQTDQDTPPPPEPSGDIYYVSPSGNNANSGTSESPWATPGYASRQLKPGDTLIVRPGTYSLSVYDDDIILPTSGTPTAWITIQGQSGTLPRLEGSANLICAIDISRSSYIRIQNLEITSAAGKIIRDGIAGMEHDINGVLLEDLDIHHINEFGINISDVNDIRILNCRLDYCGMGGIGGPVGYLGGWRNAKISGCSLSYSGHFYRGGENPYDRPDGFGIEPSEGPIEISDTIAEHNLGDGLDSKSANTDIHHCIVANNRCDGVKLWQGGSKIENTSSMGQGTEIRRIPMGRYCDRDRGVRRKLPDYQRDTPGNTERRGYLISACSMTALFRLPFC